MIQHFENLRMLGSVEPLDASVLKRHFDTRNRILEIIDLKNFIDVNLVHTTMLPV